jgi:hypothetical protein
LAEGGNADAIDILYTVIRHHQSTCTIKGAVAILARIKEPRIYDMLIRLLPQDISYFPMGIPKALGEFGDERYVEGEEHLTFFCSFLPFLLLFFWLLCIVLENVVSFSLKFSSCRCVPALLQFANLKQQLPKVKWMLQINSIESLIYFKHVPEVMENLKYGLENSKFSDYCLHLLYAATNDDQYWEKITALSLEGKLEGGFTLFHLDKHMLPEQAARLQEAISM